GVDGSQHVGQKPYLLESAAGRREGLRSLRKNAKLHLKVVRALPTRAMVRRPRSTAAPAGRIGPAPLVSRSGGRASTPQAQTQQNRRESRAEKLEQTRAASAAARTCRRGRRRVLIRRRRRRRRRGHLDGEG